MPSRDFNATGTPQSIAAALGLASGQEYVGQNVSTTATLFAREADTAPPPEARVHRHEAGGFFYFTPGGSSDFWLWTDDVDGCAVIVTEAR